MTWEWVEPEAILDAHDRQIAEHGGGSGIRDQGLLESALARPQHLATYGEPDACSVAAAYAFGIARNHPFVDGNKRTAFIAGALFLVSNGQSFEATDDDVVATVLALAEGRLDESTLAAWYRRHLSEA